MEQNFFWEANSFSASKKNTWILWKSYGQHRFHKSLPLLPILSQINPLLIALSGSLLQLANCVGYEICI
jgi:hypothetical protein